MHIYTHIDAYIICDGVLVGLLIFLVECLGFLTAWCSKDETAI